MVRVGITGAIGAGKSFLGELLRQRNFQVLDADKMVHELYRDNKQLRNELAAAFGENCLTPFGVDRRYIADLIFKDDAKRIQLEAIVYPYLTQAVECFFGKAENDADYGDYINSFASPKVKFVEAALFSRTPEIVKMLDEIWIVEASEEIRLRRLVARGLDEDDAARRIQNQHGACDVSLFPKQSIKILKNDEGRPSLERQMDNLLREIL